MKPKFYRKVLENGLTVVLEKRDSPAVSLALAVKCGGINETIKEKGISHFVEHMLYKGTKNRDSKKIAEEIEKKGGILNGFTDETVTAYWCKMPKKHVDVALDVLTDLIQNPLFREEDIDKERLVILEEIKMYKDSPRNHVFNEMQKLMYKEPFEIPLIGTEKILRSLAKDDLIQWFKKFYVPKNIVLCVVGDVKFEKIVNFAEKNFSKREPVSPEKGKEKKPRKISRPKVIKRKGIKTEKRKGVDQANILFSYHVPTLKDKKNFAARVLSVLMAGGMSSRLFNEIREKRNLAYAVKGSSEISGDFGYSYVYVGTKKDAVPEVKKILVDEFMKVHKDLSKEELNQVKEEIIGNLQISMENSQVQMAHLLHYEVEGNAKNFYQIEKNIRSVKLGDVKSIAKKAAKDHSFFALVPE